MLYRSNIARVLCPVIDMITLSGTPARDRLRAPDLLKSWNWRPGTPARSQAEVQAFLKTWIGFPSRAKTWEHSGQLSSRSAFAYSHPISAFSAWQIGRCSRSIICEVLMRNSTALSIVVLIMLSCTVQHAQPSVSPVAFSAAEDTVPAFSPAGPITLPVVRQLIEITRQNGKERGELLVVYDPQGGHYFWRYLAQHSLSDTGSFLNEFKTGSAGIFVTSESLTEFLSASSVVEHKGKSYSLVTARDASMGEIQQNLRVAAQIDPHPGVKIIPLNDAPPLVGFQKSADWTKALPTFKPIPREFWCVPYGEPGQGPCTHGTLIMAIDKQGDNWRLVLRNRWAVEIVLDPSFNPVSSKDLRTTSK
jgi:hypothetical protein